MAENGTLPVPAVETTPQSAPAPSAEQVPESEVVLENPQVRAVFTTRGGRLKQWVLKDYKDTEGSPVDLVAAGVPAGQPAPLEIESDQPQLAARANGAAFSPQVDTAARRVTFSWSDGSGLVVRKVFELEASGYLLHVRASAVHGSTAVPIGVVWGSGLGDLRATTGGGFFSRDVARAPEALWHNGESVTRVSFGDAASESPTGGAMLRFVGLDDHYFIAAAVKVDTAAARFSGYAHPVEGSDGRERQLLTMVLRPKDQAADLAFYVGPKAFDVMQGVDPEFVRAINFGFWSWLAVPFLDVLKWIHGFSGNWGWAIVILTVIMNIVIFPLRHKTAISMRKMQEIQPQMKAIQDRYAGLKATDPARQKMNSEIMALYKEKGANPISGCLPTVLTFPLLFAFYALLSEAIELRNAPFGWWIQDLSTHDPLFVTPILMGGTMLWQQWITPATGDPMQRRMMMFMPLLFVGMFLTLPSGLAIYYLVNTVWAIGQQYFTNWLLGPPAAHAPRPAAERRVKQVGSGRTQKVEQKS